MQHRQIDTTGVDAVELVTLKSFTKTFWRVYAANTAGQQDIFYALDEIYYDRFGEHRFPSYDAFRMARDRRTKRKK